MRGYIFLCSVDTQEECFEKMLFGGTANYSGLTGEVQPGDRVFLYNYITKQIHGVFEATSNSAMNIDPSAWEGRYPWQVKVRRDGEMVSIPKRDFEKFIPFPHKKFPLAALTEDQVNDLIFLLRIEEPISESTQDFRNKYPAKYRADDGHMVRSLSEQAIDNWLFHHGISHGYERKLPIEEDMLCDFYIPLRNSVGYLYIEFWGINDDEYQRRKEKKQSLYKKHNLKLIDLYPKDLETLDDVLPIKIRHFIPEEPFN